MNILSILKNITAMGSPYYHRELEDTSPALPGHHRSRSASRPPHTIDYPSNTFFLKLFCHLKLHFLLFLMFSSQEQDIKV